MLLKITQIRRSLAYASAAMAANALAVLELAIIARAARSAFPTVPALRKKRSVISLLAHVQRRRNVCEQQRRAAAEELWAKVGDGMKG